MTTLQTTLFEAEVTPADIVNNPGSPPAPTTTDTTQPDEPVKPRPGSRADRMAQPLTRDVLTGIAEHHKVCVRPLAIRRVDKDTGQTNMLDVPCGARLASKCKPCAERNRKQRQVQIREGWHLTQEPVTPVEAPSEDVKAAVALRCQFAFDREQSLRSAEWAQVTELDHAIEELDEQLSTMRVRGGLAVPAAVKQPRRTRSTKHRHDTTDLPRLPIEKRTVGRLYTAKDGKIHQPSTLLTITLPSYGPVHTSPRTRRGQMVACDCGHFHGQQDPLLGTPFDPDTYDYRSAALDAVFFAQTLDRFWQNLRRAVGWNIQYAGAVEMQKRITPHAHYAMRGTIPNKILKQAAAASYHQAWLPNFDQPVYSVDKPPVWDEIQESYVDPKTGLALKTWAEALDEVDTTEDPAFLARLGAIHSKGITPGTKEAERSIRYVTKYLTKDLSDQVRADSEAQKQHFNRLHQELSTVPCSPTCANWLLYAVQPHKAKPGLVPGRCSGKVHQRQTLGFTGRRVLISRNWSGKTLADHRADQRTWIRTVLSGALSDDEMPNLREDRYTYQLAKPNEPDVPALQIRIMHSIAVRQRWKTALQQALAPPGPVPAFEINRQDRSGPGAPPSITEA